jgi:hypothetical protein
MSDLAAQASFNTGEWAPSLYARVDLAKYRSGAALLSNFFVDYRGGASTRPGTKYILQCYKSATPVRLIPMQATFNIGYVLEFGQQYVRFFVDGAPILEAATSITNATAGPPEVFTDAGHGYLNGDWIFAGGNYYIIANATTNTFTLTDLFGNAIATNPFILPTAASRVYTVATPYAAADLAVLKFAQNVNELILCHPNYKPYVLTIITAANWTLLPITFGSTASPPTGGVINATFPAPGSAPADTFYAYVITSIDANGQESSPSAVINGGPTFDIRSVAGSLAISWTAVAGAVAYNVYKADVSYFGVIPPGSTFGFVGTTTGTELIDSNIGADFSQTPPIAKNPFQGEGVASVAVTVPGTYTAVPTVAATGASSTIAASLTAILQVQGTPTVGAGGTGYAIGDSVSFTNGVALIVNTVSGGVVTSWKAITATGASAGSVFSGTTPANPVAQLTTSGAGIGATANLVWGVGLVQVLNPGAGYTSVPTMTFSPTGATAVATLAATSNGNPSVPGFFQQRLVLAAPNGAPQTFYMSQPGSYFNFNVSNPSEATDSITGTLVSGQLNTIKSMISQTTGLLMLTDKASWLITGGGNGTAVSPSALVANAQSFNGASDVPPIVSNFDVLYVQSKGSIVRDSAYNIYANVFTGTDISVISSHLFYGFTVQEWAWAEEPFKVVWAVRNDGVMLTLTFLKEQEFTAWTHSTTTNGLFKSVATVTEGTATAGEVDAIYTVVARTIEGQSLQYIERVAERTYPGGVVDAWTVDCAIQYVGPPATNFSGAQFLAGQTVTGLADGKVITTFVMPSTGAFTLPSAASKVTVGLGFIAQLQTLALELGEPTVQGKVKKINNVDIRVTETLGLSIGSDFNHLVPMKDLVQGNVSSMLTGQASQIVTDLVTGDARTYLDPTYTVPGQYCIQQSLPYPATILGVFPSITQGDQGGRAGA